ncbi:MAG: transposase [Gammaproteobacteria bacterium]|nr:transposase [Gammaproteobacteria bacterium]
MGIRHTQSYKIQAVEKALNRSPQTSLQEIADSLGVGYSTLGKWISKSRKHELENVGPMMKTKEKRPQDWSLEERLTIVISCASLEEEKMNAYCREQGIYSHHVKQWKEDFANGHSSVSKVTSQTQLKQLKKENKILKKDLNRKDKALAETAALLVLQKKVNAIWGSDEGSLQ